MQVYLITDKDLEELRTKIKLENLQLKNDKQDKIDVIHRKFHYNFESWITNIQNRHGLN